MPNFRYNVPYSDTCSYPFAENKKMLQESQKSQNSKENHLFSLLKLKHKTPLALAPMAGITDNPFRQIAKQLGADYAVSEMMSSDPSLQNTRKSLQRRDHTGETGIIAVQIAGSDPQQLAQAAQFNYENGAQIIDINMGCPAKKVCNVLAGSALLQNEPLVEDILNTVVRAVPIPVTLKTRLGWDDEHKNILTIAKMAEQAGITALAIHGRTRTQMYTGSAQYDLIAQVKQSISLPIWANGDITTPQKAVHVLEQTGVDGIMIGRGAQGQPWLFQDIRFFMENKQLPPPMPFAFAQEIALNHLKQIHDFYGEIGGVRIARKHLAWYIARLPESQNFRKHLNTIESASQQYDAFAQFLEQKAQEHEFWFRDY